MTQDKNTSLEQVTGEATPLPSPAKNDHFIEEVNVVRVEGRYFCFDGREANRRGQGVYEYVNSDGRQITIETGRFGYPSILAYRILQAFFRHITLEGKPYPDRIVFTQRELGRLVGRNSFGGQDSKDIYRAIKQLEDTKVVLSGELSKAFEFEDSFRIILNPRIIREKSEHNLKRHGALHAIALQMNPAIMDSIRKGHIAVFNWGILEALEPVQAALYKRLYLHLCNIYEKNGLKKDTLTFEKDYEAICAEWLGGLSPQKYKSDIMKQLKPHLESLAKSGLLRSYAVEARAKGQGFKIIFRPGKGFFLDYEHFYRIRNVRQLQFKNTSNQLDYHDPIDVVLAFFSKAKGVPREEDSLDKGDIEYARELITKYGKPETMAFIDYAVEKATRTKFDMQTFRALKTYTGQWDANQVERERLSTLQKQKDREARLVSLRADYDDLTKKHVSRCLQLKSEADREALRKAAETYVLETHGKGPAFPMMVTSRIRTMVLEKAPIPPFDDWVKELD